MGGGEDFREAGAARKAVGLFEDGKVHYVGDGETYLVEGRRGEYVVILFGNGASCTCPSEAVACSHVRAARHARGVRLERVRIEEAGGDPFAGLT